MNTSQRRFFTSVASAAQNKSLMVIFSKATEGEGNLAPDTRQPSRGGSGHRSPFSRKTLMDY
jgi:hypothetical protein